VTGLCLVQYMDVLGVTVVITALPSMLASLHASQAYGTLVATGYAMFFGGLLMLGARLGDRYGHRRTILVSLAVLAAASSSAASSPTWPARPGDPPVAPGQPVSHRTRRAGGLRKTRPRGALG
jgi:MFS family permease